MTLIEPGRVCTVLKGSDAGKTAIVKKIVDSKTVIIASESVKERRVSISHLQPLAQTAPVPASGKSVKAQSVLPKQSVQTAKASNKQATEKKSLLKRLVKKTEPKKEEKPVPAPPKPTGKPVPAAKP